MWMLFDPVWSPEWVWLRYATFLRASILIGMFGLAAALLRSAPASLRAGLWAVALLALLPLPELRALPLYWSVHVVPPPLASPLIAIGTTMVTQSSSAASRVPWTVIVGVVWLLGALLVAARLLRGWFVIRGLGRRAEPVQAASWLRLVEETRGALVLHRPVRVLRSHETGVPVTWGTWRPTVLLPADADEWPQAYRRAVLLHELAHIRRLDCLLAVLTHLACALWWFHPAVWWAAGRLRAERERACDERVLLAGVLPSEYAECLLRIAADSHTTAVPGFAVAASLLRRSELHGRLHVILNPARAPRGPAHRGLTAGAILCAVAVVLLVGSMRLSPRPDVLWTALQSHHWATRAYAAETIARFGDPASLKALDAALLHEEHRAVHHMAAFGERLRARHVGGVVRFGWPSSPPHR